MTLIIAQLANFVKLIIIGKIAVNLYKIQVKNNLSIANYNKVTAKKS
ncbi:MAG: hypothetical protein WCV92_01845 [Candidatus Buchananbacteria bacterium]